MRFSGVESGLRAGHPGSSSPKEHCHAEAGMSLLKRENCNVTSYEDLLYSYYVLETSWQ